MNFKELQGVYNDLKAGGHGYQTVGIDTTRGSEVQHDPGDDRPRRQVTRGSEFVLTGESGVSRPRWCGV